MPADFLQGEYIPVSAPFQQCKMQANLQHALGGLTPGWVSESFINTAAQKKDSNANNNKKTRAQPGF